MEDGLKELHSDKSNLLPSLTFDQFFYRKLEIIIIHNYSSSGHAMLKTPVPIL